MPKYQHSRFFVTVCVAAVTLMFLSPAGASADFTLTGSETLSISTSAGNVGLYDLSHLDVVEGGAVVNLNAYDFSTASLSGGTVEEIQARGSAAMSISGGVMGSFTASQTSSVTVSGGVIEGDAYADDSSTVVVTGGDTGSVIGSDTSHVSVSGGTMGYLAALNSSTMSVTGGRVEYLDAMGTGSVSISGGTVGGVWAGLSSTITISGGATELLYASDSSLVTLSGGSLIELCAFDTSSVTIRGRDFSFGEGLAFSNGRVVGEGILSGNWFNSTPWELNISTNDSGAMILADSHTEVAGDFNNNGGLDGSDIDLIFDANRVGTSDLLYDLDGSGAVGQVDRDLLICGAQFLASTYGDATLDRTVSVGDLGVLAGNWGGMNKGWGQGDFNGDGLVNVGDLGILAGHWGWTAPVAEVPEPASLMLLAAGALGVCRRRQRRLR